jgi:hypothetical protein
MWTEFPTMHILLTFLFFDWGRSIKPSFLFSGNTIIVYNYLLDVGTFSWTFQAGFLSSPIALTFQLALLHSFKCFSRCRQTQLM